MRFWLLGPLRVGHTGAPTAISARKSRTLLAALLLEANTAVSTERLVEALWGASPPASAMASLHNHLLRLRRTLGGEGGARVLTAAPGYLVRVEPGELDSHMFAEHSARGRSAELAGRWADASEHFAAALALWRGAPLADTDGLDGWQTQLQRLNEDRLQTLEARIGAELQLGRHAQVIGELYSLTADHSLRESLHGKLMTALYRSDRQAEALDVFRRLRHTLIEELGVEPSPAVQQLHRQILAVDPLLAAPAAVDTGRASRPHGPTVTAAATSARVAGLAGLSGPRHQLPADTRVFTGRTRELDELLALADAAPAGSDAGMVVVSALDGMAGVGKSALVVHAAHRISDRFPDGQLFVDLRGNTAGIPPLSAGDALDYLLRSLNVPSQAIPRDPSERAALYRSRLAGATTLIVLDNAAGTAQVRPLLPGAPGCLVLITSRTVLAGLDDVHLLNLDVLPDNDAIALLHKVAGPKRIPEDHPAVAELIDLCGGLPLAVRIVAARLRHHRSLRIEDLAQQLRDENLRLDHLKDEDRNLTAVFDLSYAALPADEQLLFRRLGQVPGPDFDAYAAANLISADHRTAERSLESLLDHNLLQQRSPGRYRFHDLVRLHARALGIDDSAEERDKALDRLLEYYRRTAEAADRRLGRRHTASGPPSVPATPDVAPALDDRSVALTWMRTERDNLIAAAHASRVVPLAAALAGFLELEGPWAQAAALHRTAAAAAHDQGDRLGEACALHACGRVTHMTGDMSGATELHEGALAIHRQLGDRLGEANVLWDLGRIRLATGNPQAASGLQERALSTYQDIGDSLGQANTLWELGRLRLMAGDYPPGIDLQERALKTYRDIGHRQGEAYALWELGRLRFSTGDYPAAGELHEQALRIFQDLGSRQGEAGALAELGAVRLLTGNYPVAAELLERAETIYRELGHRLNRTYALWALGRVQLANGDQLAAAELLEQALTMFRALKHRQGEACTLGDLGRLQCAGGDYLAAAESLKLALAIFRDFGDRQGETEVLNSTGALVAATRGPAEAQTLYRQALRLAREAYSPLDEARALEGTARCAERMGDRPTALADLRRATAIYRRTGAAEGAAAAAYLAALEGDGPPGGPDTANVAQHHTAPPPPTPTP
ncbi:DNA-binding SARP family transcriptional activator [Streptomyces sp. 846.5]|nr:BTAD domain-containing putative transcriptional regulator [Streptomyces sp. 846.5]TDT98299.1 DNA-binding SARP family transcriptional activator [Streptomyces sp. 846.5]